MKLTQTSNTSLTLTYDDPAGSGDLKTFKLSKSDLSERLAQVRVLLGRKIKDADIQNALTAMVDELRRNKAGLPNDYDFAPLINVELEA